jgi:hypothetical protein
MPASNFGSGLDDIDPPTPKAPAQRPTGSHTQEPAAEPVPEPVEAGPPRAPFTLEFGSEVIGLPLELGAGAHATLVDLADGEGFLSVDSTGALKAGIIERGDSLSVGSLTQILTGQDWAAFDARTCQQTGSVLFVGIDRRSGRVHASVELESAFRGGLPCLHDLGHLSDLGLPVDTARILALQLTDWHGRGRLELIAHIKPEREGGGPSLVILERKGDSLAEGFHPAALADADVDALLGRHPASRLILVSWTGPGADQLLHITGDGHLNLLSNFGGMLPPGTGKPRPVVAGSPPRPVVLPGSTVSVSWVKPLRERAGRLVLTDATGGVSIVAAQPRESIGPVVSVLSKVSGDLVFGPAAVATATDWDNDGGIDIVVGTADGGLILYPDRGQPGTIAIGSPIRLDSGGDPFRVPTRDTRKNRDDAPDTGKPRYACPTLCDWTAHQRMDAVVSDARGAVWYMRNNGHKTQPRLDFADRVTSGGKPLFVSPRSQVAVGHWSSAAEPDLIAFDEAGELTFWPRRDKLDHGPGTKILDARERPIRLGGPGRRGGLTHLWAGEWTTPGSVELILTMTPATIGRFADWIEAPLEKPLADFPLFWILHRNAKGGVVTLPLRTAEGELIHRHMSPGATSFSICGVTYAGRTQPDLLIVPDQGKAMIWPRESLRWD